MERFFTTFLKISKIINIGRIWTHIRRIGLRIKDFESQRCYQANGTTGNPQNSHIKFKIDQKIPRPKRPNCPLNLAINRPIWPGDGIPPSGVIENCGKSLLCHWELWQVAIMCWNLVAFVSLRIVASLWKVRCGFAVRLVLSAYESQESKESGCGLC